MTSDSALCVSPWEQEQLQQHQHPPFNLTPLPSHLPLNTHTHRHDESPPSPPRPWSLSLFPQRPPTPPRLSPLPPPPCPPPPPLLLLLVLLVSPPPLSSSLWPTTRPVHEAPGLPPPESQPMEGGGTGTVEGTERHHTNCPQARGHAHETEGPNYAGTDRCVLSKEGGRGGGVGGRSTVLKPVAMLTRRRDIIG